MKLDPALTEAPKAIRSCPKCGHKGYTVTTKRKDAETLEAEAINCDACGYDILPRYKATLHNPWRPSTLDLALYFASAALVAVGGWWFAFG